MGYNCWYYYRNDFWPLVNFSDINKNIKDRVKIYLMQDLMAEIRQTLLYMVAWGIFASANLIVGGHAELLPGFLLGWFASLIYFLLMTSRIKKSLTVPPQKAVAFMRMGWYIRLSFVLMVLIISVKVPQISFWAAVVGLFSYQCVLILTAVLFVLKGAVTKNSNK